MNTLVQQLPQLRPEMILLVGAVVCMMMGLARSVLVRRATIIAAVGAVILAWLAIRPAPASSGPHAHLLAGMAPFVKNWVCVIGGLLLLLAAGVPTRLKQTQEADLAGSKPGTPMFDPAITVRGEFFAFLLLSLTGVMLCAGAGDLAWLFLALELTSLPTYIVIATSRDREAAQESAIKYFFLGAMSAAVFLYGFALIYGATGATNFDQIRIAIGERGVSSTLVLGVALSLVGLSFKIAAVPMHYYAADVYQGAATPLAAFLAFVPKTAGFISIILILSLLPGRLAASAELQPLVWLLWVMAALTMTVGNVLGLMQTSVKRMLAYSSVAHSGYMLVALVGGISTDTGDALSTGVAAVLFYLVAYGFGNLAAFAVLSSLRNRGEEADHIDDLAGLVKEHPRMAAALLLSLLSLLGIPPLVGFTGKIYLFGSAIHGGLTNLVIIAVINSAISGVYYLRIVSTCFFANPNPETTSEGSIARPVAATIASVGAVLYGIFGSALVSSSHDAVSNAPKIHVVEAPPLPSANATAAK